MQQFLTEKISVAPQHVLSDWIQILGRQNAIYVDSSFDDQAIANRNRHGRQTRTPHALAPFQFPGFFFYPANCLI